MYLHWLISFPNGGHGSMVAHRNWACELAVGGWVSGWMEASTDLGQTPEGRLKREAATDQVYSG